jgi:CheY-like chemotaxis protein
LARRILLADDSVTAQNMGRRILTDAGYEVVTVNNGSAALKKIAENKPDLIVLDVYMPAYGGLEVCQRIKESAETTRIPVLLTVGKLEPFKPEEARRVRADAFIIKPFEATELLTAISKLEDNIVAQPQPQKSGRFARALAEVEKSAAAERFGDKETGWKNRLTIPGLNLDSKRAEAEVVEANAPPSRDLERGEAGKAREAKQEFERPITGVPADITPEEIAAITAAAATFGGTTDESVAGLDAAPSGSGPTPEVAAAETVVVQPSEPGPLAATLAWAPEKQVQVEGLTQAEPVWAEGEGVSPALAPSEAASVEDKPAAAELSRAAAEASETRKTTPETEVCANEKSVAGDAEVMAAIASLVPTNGHAIEGTQPGTQGSNGRGQDVPAAVYGSVACAHAATGPRWIAEPVALALEESTLALEHEMDQAYAANAAAEAARNSLATATTLESLASVSVAEPLEPAIAMSVGVRESVAAAAESVAMPAAAGDSIDSSMAPSSEPAMANQAAAYAAAASAGSIGEHVPPVEAVSSASPWPEFSGSKSGAPVDGAPHREAELAEAWQNWKQIRESFVGSEPSSPVIEAAALETSSHEQEAAQPAEAAAAEVVLPSEEVETVASDSSAESTTIASIVDSMLAELRPKLVEEIAKKMNSEKKEKEKKKKK